MTPRQALSLTCALAFFLATLVGILDTVNLGRVFSFISGSAFLAGAVWDLLAARKNKLDGRPGL